MLFKADFREQFQVREQLVINKLKNPLCRAARGLHSEKTQEETLVHVLDICYITNKNKQCGYKNIQRSSFFFQERSSRCKNIRLATYS